MRHHTSPGRAAKIPHRATLLPYKSAMQAALPESGSTMEDPSMRVLFLAATVALLAGCGASQFDRVSTGAGTGARTGAAIGAGVGAVTGGATSQDQLDLGKPVWK